MNQIIVIKMGGIAIKHLTEDTLIQIKNWIKQNYQIVIVHGGGNIIESLLIKAKHPTIKKDGLRVTAKEDLFKPKYNSCYWFYWNTSRW